MHDTAHDLWNYLIQTASLGTIAMSLLGVFPAFAAVIAATWYALQIYESDTVQKWLKQRRQRTIARLEAKLTLIRSKHDA